MHEKGGRAEKCVGPEKVGKAAFGGGESGHGREICFMAGVGGVRSATQKTAYGPNPHIVFVFWKNMCRNIGR
jgi:hypothetical protein